MRLFFMSKRKNKQNRRKMQARNKQANNSIDRADLGHVGLRTAGELRRGRALKADHKRNIAEQAGYPDTISLRQHYDMAYRNGLGSNLAFSIVNDTWRVAPVIFDGDEDADRRKNNPTEFEIAVDEHFTRLKAWERLKGLDKAQRPMRYGAMMYVTSEQDSANTIDELVTLPTMDYLVGLRVYHEAQLEVSTAVQNPANINYGSPLIFDLKTNVAGSTNEWEESGYQIHASRVFAYGEGALDGSIYGIPCNEGCFEALMDAAKVRMSGAEGFFQNASNKYANTLPENSTLADANAILDSMDDFDNDISRSLVTVGDVKMLQTTLADPTNAWTIAVNECAAHHSKPMTILVGHQTGERASGEDIKNWNRVIMDRQEQVGNEMITGLLNDWMIKFNFPEPKDKINIVWRDLNESTAEQQVDLAKKRAETNKVCVDSKMQPVYSTEYIQKEAGAPVEDVIVLDDGGEGDE
jgi:hypothetical protein